MTPDRVAASIASFDFLYLSELEPLGIVAPSVRGDDSRVHAAQQGGHVLEPVAGLHDNVWVFDFKSLYPSVIRTFNIDPLSYVESPTPQADLIETPGWRISSRARDPAAVARRALPAARSRAPGGRRGRLARHQDPDELLLWRARHARLSLLQPGARELDHRHGTRGPVVVEALVRGGRLRGAVRRHGQPVRADADDGFRGCSRPGATARRGADRRSRAIRRRNAGAYRAASSSSSRSSISSCSCRMRATARAARASAMPGSGTATASTRWSSSAWRSCVATGRRSQRRCSASCIAVCSPTSRSTCTWPTSSSACAAASSTTHSSIARTCARTPRSTPPRRRRTSRRRASRRRRQDA